jgi:hypothetical protein
MGNEYGNGSNRAIWWIMGIVASVLVLLSSFVVANLHSRLLTVESVSASRGERIAQLEARNLAVAERNVDIDRRLIRIESKLDDLTSQMRRP